MENTVPTTGAPDKGVVDAPTKGVVDGPDPSSKDAVDGLGKGVANIATGALGGAALMLFAPAAGAASGYKEDGAWGAFKGFGMGLGSGIVGGVAMACGGVVTGGAQIGRGIYHTPGAVQKSNAGMDFNEETREWIVYNLEKEADEVLTINEEVFLKAIADQIKGDKGEEEKNIIKPDVVVKEMEYYDILSIKSNATASQVKKAYYMKARSSHPDKHPDDPDAQSKFQKVGEAYQVLSDEKLRSNYDSHGKDGINDAPKMDSASLYAMIFGSEKFEEYIGELQLATQMGVDSSKPEESHAKFLQFKQKKRAVQCAVNLTNN